MAVVLRLFGRDLRRDSPSAWTVGRRRTDLIERERRLIEDRIESQGRRLAGYRNVQFPR